MSSRESRDDPDGGRARADGGGGAAGRAARSRPRSAPGSRRGAARTASSASSSTSFTYATVCSSCSWSRGFRAAFIVALAWGIGLVFHYFGALVAPDLRRRSIDREVARQVASHRRPSGAGLDDRHARSLEELSASIAHEIRNPITAAKSLVQQMGEDPTAAENVEYARVALEELDRVERSVSHLLRFAREEEMRARATCAWPTWSTPRSRPSASALARSGVELVREHRRRGRAARRRREAAARGHQPGRQRARRARREPHADAAHRARASGENLAGDEVWVRVRDNGPGIDAEALAARSSARSTPRRRTAPASGLAISQQAGRGPRRHARGRARSRARAPSSW